MFQDPHGDGFLLELDAGGREAPVFAFTGEQQVDLGSGTLLPGTGRRRSRCGALGAGQAEIPGPDAHEDRLPSFHELEEEVLRRDRELRHRQMNRIEDHVVREEVGQDSVPRARRTLGSPRADLDRGGTLARRDRYEAGGPKREVRFGGPRRHVKRLLARGHFD